MNIAQIEKNLQKLMKSFNQDSFIYNFLLAYGLPKASITRLQKGNLNLSKIPGEISWKKKLFFKAVSNEDSHVSISTALGEIKHDERFVIVTDYQTLLAIDTKTNDKLDIKLGDLPKHYDFFLPWAGMEKTVHANENPADVKAAERMAKLFDEIKKDNPDDSPEFIHGLNVFLSRLLFCFFAEDTNIFSDNQFTNSISSNTQPDGSDLGSYLDKLFVVLNQTKKDRINLPDYLDSFPYVNGGLFEKKLKNPTFTRRSRQAIIDSGELDWSAINPDIFGSMIQAVVTPEHRGGFGMHYTSVPNIMKVIEPLFLNDLYQLFEKSKGNLRKLNELLNRLSKIKIFDPACGSGNFLIIAYKELRRLEILVFQEKARLEGKSGTGSLSLGNEYLSNIKLSQFYGIELDDFAHEIAQLSLWLAEHQMNVEFKNEFGQTNPTLPLKEAGKIIRHNACRIDWETVCPKRKGDEIYILGNPPYLGYSVQKEEQKEDMKFVLSQIGAYKSLDYISSWFWKSALFIKGANVKSAFVSTNSLVQGEQVSIFWPSILKNEIEICFAHQSFKWSNSAKANAGVSCVIIGISNKSNSRKLLFNNGHHLICENITPYLTPGSNTIVTNRNKPISNISEIGYGSSALDGGHLILSSQEYEEVISKVPEIRKYCFQLIGSQELIKGLERWAIWIEDNEYRDASKIKVLKERFDLVKKFRLNSKRPSTIKAASYPYKFGEPRFQKGDLIIIPKVSSERRTYIPIGYYSKQIVVMDKAFPIYNTEPYLFGILSSLMHAVWLKAVGGKLETRLSYSSSIVYNTFPFPHISEQRKAEITQCVFRILEEREKHTEKTLAELYDPNKMPQGLREAHRANDEVIEKCYRARPFENDEERLEFLFKLYEKMIEEEKYKGSLFEVQKKTKKRKHA